MPSVLLQILKIVLDYRFTEHRVWSSTPQTKCRMGQISLQWRILMLPLLDLDPAFQGESKIIICIHDVVWKRMATWKEMFWYEVSTNHNCQQSKWPTNQINNARYFLSRGEGEVSQDRVWWIDNMKYWVEGVAVLVLCLAGILGGSFGGFISTGSWFKRLLCSECWLLGTSTW